MARTNALCLISIFLVAAGCDRTTAPNGRAFAPRMVGTPSANRIRVEVADRALDASYVQNGGFYRQQEANYSDGRMGMDGLPESIGLWFRVSGLDAASVPIWSSTGSVPGGTVGTVQIGGAGGIQVSSPPAPAFSASGNMVQIQCPSASQAETVAWVLDHSDPGPTNGNTLRSGGQSTASVTPTSGIVRARCTDGIAWGSIATWKSAPLPTSLPAPSGVLPQVSIGVPPAATGSGAVTFSVPGGIQQAQYTNWQVAVKTSSQPAYAAHDLQYTVSTSGIAWVNAYLVAWDTTTSTWVAGPTAESALGYSSVLTSPTFRDVSGNMLPSTWNKDTTALQVQVSAPSGSILYTTDGLDPVPDAADAFTWMAGQILPFPSDSDSLVVKAISFDRGQRQVSPISTLTVRRPSWIQAGSSSVGCLSGTGPRVVACGDGRGPLLWVNSQWTRVDPTWTHGNAQVLFQDDTTIVVATAGQVWRQSNSHPNFQPLGAPFNSVAGITRFQGRIWVSAEDGLHFWDGVAWNAPTGIVPANPGPLWTGFGALWAGVGSSIWKYDGAVWSTTGSPGAVIGFFQDPWNTFDILVGNSNGLQELMTTPMGGSGSNLVGSLPHQRGLAQAIVWNNRIYAAFDNEAVAPPQGGIQVATSWSSGWSNLGAHWPQASAIPGPAVGIAATTSSLGSGLLLASTPSGTWTLTLP